MPYLGHVAVEEKEKKRGRGKNSVNRIANISYAECVEIKD